MHLIDHATIQACFLVAIIQIIQIQQVSMSIDHPLRQTLFIPFVFVCSLKIAATLPILPIITKRTGCVVLHTGTVSIFSWSQCPQQVSAGLLDLHKSTTFPFTGYGDVSCRTVLGKIALVLFILVGLVGRCGHLFRNIVYARTLLLVLPALDRFSKTSREAKLKRRRPKMENGDYLRLFLLEIPA